MLDSKVGKARMQILSNAIYPSHRTAVSLLTFFNYFNRNYFDFAIYGNHRRHV
jgi:hypothetical protein